MGDNNAQVFLQEDMQLPAIKWLGEQVPGGFFVYLADESQQIVFANNACQRLFGCETKEQFDELTGNTFRGLVHPDDYERVQKTIEEQIACGENNNMDYVEYRILRRDDSQRA